MKCRRTKQMSPAMRMSTALSVVSKVDAADPLKLSNSPMLKMSRSAPNIIPLIPALESIRLVVRE